MELSSGDQAQQLVQSTHLAQYGDDQRPETWLEESLSFIFQHVLNPKFSIKNFGLLGLNQFRDNSIQYFL